MKTIPKQDREGLFCESVPALQKAWDSTSYRMFMECPYKYYLTIILGWQKAKMPPPLWWGILIHTGMETLIKEKAKGNKHYLRAAIRRVLTDAGDYVSDDTARSRTTLVRALVWYDAHYANDPIQPLILSDGEPAAELSFRLPLPIESPDGDAFMLSGHLDAAVEFTGANWIQEHKSTKSAITDRYFEQFTPDAQITIYTLASAIVLSSPAQGVILNAIQTGVHFTRFMRKPIKRTQEILDEFLKDMALNLSLAESYARAGHWPQNQTSCHKYSGCQFCGVCSKSKSVRENFLKADFIYKPWNPLESR